MADLEVSLDLDYSSFERKLKSIPKTVGGVAESVAKAWTGVSLALAGQGVNAAAEFEQAMAKIAMLGLPNSDVAKLRKQILDLPPALGKAADVAAAVQKSLSSGVSTNNVMEQVTVAAKLAKAGMAGLMETTDTLNGFLAAYKGHSLSAKDVTDLLAKSVDLGRAEIKDMVAGLGQVASGAAEAGVSQLELMAAISTLTNQGVDASEAITRVKDVIVSLQKPAAHAREAMSDLMGEDYSSSAQLKAEGLFKTLTTLREAVGDDTELFGHLMHGVNAYYGALGLGKDGAREFGEIMKGLEDRAGKAEFAFKKMGDTGYGKFEQLNASINKLFVGIGDVVLPHIKNAVDALVANMDVLGHAAEVALAPVYAAMAIGKGIGKQVGTAAAIGGSFLSGGASAAQATHERAQAQENASRQNLFQNKPIGWSLGESVLNNIPGGQLLGMAFGGYRDGEGDVSAGKAYVWNESTPTGKEMIIPKQDGRIVKKGIAPLAGNAGYAGGAAHGGSKTMTNIFNKAANNGVLDGLFAYVEGRSEKAAHAGSEKGMNAGARKGLAKGTEEAVGGKDPKSGKRDGMSNSIFRGATSSLVDAFLSGDVKGGIKGFGKNLAGTAKAMLMEALKSALMGGMGKLFGKLKLFGAGGDPTPGEPYIAGETGPELIMSRDRQRVYSPEQTRGMLRGGGIHIERVYFSPAPGANGQQSFVAFMKFIEDTARRGGSTYFPREIEPRRR